MGETNLSSLSKIGKKYIFCCCFEFGIYLLIILSWLWEGAGKAACRCLERVLLFSWTRPLCLCEVYLPHREEEQGPGFCWGSTDKHSLHSGGQFCGFLLAVSLHISSITAASKYLLTFAPHRCGRFSIYGIFSPNAKNHCDSVVIWISTTLYKFIKSITVINLA